MPEDFLFNRLHTLPLNRVTDISDLASNSNPSKGIGPQNNRNNLQPDSIQATSRWFLFSGAESIGKNA